MFSSTSPLNWHSTLRRLKKEGGMGMLGKELGLKNKTLSAFVGDKTITPVLAKATQNVVKKVAKVHKPDEKLKKQIASSGSSSEEKGVISEAVGSPAAEVGLASPSPSSPPGMSVKDATPRKTPANADEGDEEFEAFIKEEERRSPTKSSVKAPPKTPAPSTPAENLELSFHTARSSAETPAKTPAKTPANTKTATAQIFNSPATPLGKGHGGQSKPARRVAAKLMSPTSVKKLAGEEIAVKKRPVIKQRPPRRGKLLREMLPKPKKAPLKDLPMIDPKAIVGERRKREYQKRGNKNDRVSEISDRQAKLAAANHMAEIAKAQPPPVAEPSPAKPSPAKPSPAKPVEEPPAPASPVYDYHSFRKANAGNKWTPKKMGAQWQAWKQAHPNK